jgi:MSHA biogenesis protein MshP
MINRLFQLSKVPSTVEKQRGSALMMTLFIIIVLMLLGNALIRVLSTSSEAIAQEVIGTRAYMAANSAMQAELQKLFPLNPVTGSATYCTTPVTASYDFSGQAGLYHCEAFTKCEEYATNTTTGEKFYRLTSTGTCDSSTMDSTRKIQVEARSLP